MGVALSVHLVGVFNHSTFTHTHIHPPMSALRGRAQRPPHSLQVVLTGGEKRFTITVRSDGFYFFCLFGLDRDGESFFLF
jgi:hypothetical protein